MLLGQRGSWSKPKSYYTYHQASLSGLDNLFSLETFGSERLSTISHLWPNPTAGPVARLTEADFSTAWDLKDQVRDCEQN